MNNNEKRLWQIIGLMDGEGGIGSNAFESARRLMARMKAAGTPISFFSLLNPQAAPLNDNATELAELRQRIIELNQQATTLQREHERRISEMSKEHERKIAAIQSQRETALSYQRMLGKQKKELSAEIAELRRRLGLIPSDEITPMSIKTNPRYLRAGDAVDIRGCKIEQYNPELDLNRCGGIYLGAETRINKVSGLKQIWDIYAAPQDLKNPDGSNLLLPFYNTTDENIFWQVHKLTDYHGHDGCAFETEQDLNQALDNGKYNGGWIVPTIEMLISEGIPKKPYHSNYNRIYEPYDRRTVSAALYNNRDAGAFSGGFITANNTVDLSHLYCSLSRHSVQDEPKVLIADFGYGGANCISVDKQKVSTRVVRMELRQ